MTAVARHDPLRGLKLAFALSVMAHVFMFAAGAYFTRPKPLTEQFEYIETRMVRWAPTEKPKNRLPHLNDPAPPPEKAVGTKPPEQNSKDTPATPTTESKDYSKDMEKVLNKFYKKHGKKSDYEPDGSPEGSPGGTLSPGAKQILANAYLAQVSELFRANWSIPAIIGKEELGRLECTVEFRVDGTGKIVSVRIRTPSGDSRFDNSVLAAVNATATLPLPSNEEFRNMVIQNGMFYTFIPEEGQK